MHILRGTLGKVMPFSRLVKIVSTLTPERDWYRAALAMCRLHGKLIARTGGNGQFTEAAMLDCWLTELTLCGPFPIPYHIRQMSGLEQRSPSRGTLFTWIHQPLTEICARALMEKGEQIDFVIADPGRIVSRQFFPIPGLDRRLKALPSNSFVLTKLRSSLRQGNSVICLSDADMGGSLSPNAMRVAGFAGAQVVFMYAERRPDTTIDVFYITPPHPFCESPAAVERNIEFLRAASRDGLDKLGVYSSGTSVSKPIPAPQS